MAIVNVRISYDLSGIGKYRSTVDRGLKTGTGVIGQAFNKWGDRMQKYLSTRFKVYSKGGGDWPPLASSTVKRKGHRTILVDSGLLRSAVNTRGAGSLFKIDKKPGGISIDIGGNKKYPQGRNRRGQFKKVVSVSDVARYHQEGGAKLPQRKIVVPPNQATINLMTQDLQKAIDRIADLTSRPRDAKGRFTKVV